MLKPRHAHQLKWYYRALVIIAMRDAGHKLKDIGDYFWISDERVRQICKRGRLAAQLELPGVEQ